MFFHIFSADHHPPIDRSITRTENMAARPAPVAGVRQWVRLLQAHRNFVGTPGAGGNHAGLSTSRWAPRILDRNHPGLHLHGHRFLPVPEHMFLSIKRISARPSSSTRHWRGDLNEKLVVHAPGAGWSRAVRDGLLPLDLADRTWITCAAGVPATDIFRATAGIIPISKKQ